jgi:flagellar protein FlbT
VPLRVELKPFERIVIGEAVLVNSNTRASFMIEGDAPILRESDTVTPENADTPSRRLYLCVQVMYRKNDIPRYRPAYQRLLRSLCESQPGDRRAIGIIDTYVASGALYKALKEIRKLTKRDGRCLLEPALVIS